MGQIYLSKSEADTLGNIIFRILDSGVEFNEDGDYDAITKSWIGLGIKAVKAGAEVAHPLVKKAIEDQR